MDSNEKSMDLNDGLRGRRKRVSLQRLSNKTGSTREKTAVLLRAFPSSPGIGGTPHPIWAGKSVGS
jgi:hypothetical protein